LTINEVVKNTLSSIGVPVYFSNYQGTEDTFIVFNSYLTKGGCFGDNEESITEYYIQLNLFSKGNTENLEVEILQLMMFANFKRLSQYDLYDNQTKYYNKVFRFLYIMTTN
jgi:hypothetical protein